MSKQPNYYRILGITPFAGETELKRAYRALAKRYHPDTMPPERRDWAREQMARINAAYRVLKDPQQRAQYDFERGYAPRSGYAPQSGYAQRPPAGSETPANTPGTPNSALWRRQRARERSRRQRAKQWRTVAIVCVVALVMMISYTLLFVRTRPGYVFSALLNTGLLAILLISLGATNR